MPLECSVFIAASIDGYIAKPDGDINWLHNPDYATPDNNDFGYADFINTIDIIIMGKNSYEKVVTFDKWLYTKPVIVLSRNPITIPDHLKDQVTHSNKTPTDLTTHLHNQGHKHAYIDGGITIQRFLQANLINTLIITHIPILLGDGIPLFPPQPHPTDTHLKHISTTTNPNGFVQTTYKTRV